MSTWQRIGCPTVYHRRVLAAPVKRTLIVHIGTHKTGSTSLQQMLGNLSDSLARSGIHVPVAGRSGGSHGNLIAEYSGPTRPYHDASLGGWVELPRCTAPRILISAEGFTGPSFDRGDRPSAIA